MPSDSSIRVLSADGDRAISRAVQRAVSDAVVDSAATLAAARRALDGDAYDCLVLGAGFSDGDGVSLLREVRATDDDLPVVVLASGDADHAVTELVDLGIDAYLDRAAVLRRAARADGDDSDDTDGDTPAGASPDGELGSRVRRLACEHRKARVAIDALSGDPPAGASWFIEDALDALDDVFYVYDGEGHLVSWNERLSELTGLTDADLAGMSADAFFHEADRPAVERAVEEVIRTGTTVVEARLPTDDGMLLFQLTGRRLTKPNGEVVGFCGVGRDITTHRQHEEQLARQNERLGEFARVLSHDLRNPLSVAIGFLDLERETNDSEHLERVATSLTRISDIVNDVLTAARRGTAVVEFTPVAVEAVARRAWDTVETGDATLVVESTATIHADPGRLQRLFENLFRNSVEHGSAGGRGSPLTVRVSASPADETFAVEDDGTGIDAAIVTRVFERGFTTSAEGTGFGLDIVRSLAEAHGWSVSVGSAATGGARFEFAGVEFAGVESAGEDHRCPASAAGKSGSDDS
ncbi:MULTISPECIES: ATP-binding protein [unclassified Haloferax]|uniref:ATP-binding protein n=1 Tax=unclassified Haloferax TaxID=2625095 RepID=UPI0002B0C97B|nr:MULTISPECIES: ATP-binding protein [unclassified Haloferax]ELZ60917.1 HTR-like protein [Haloferax sp. ATCC BAA-646]ELZ64234.1 HTR-like protein [Haloferax sp. ATCC BAA-645]ELZ69930.1 HTR-like protein [Haloferax sp. ATCC BAA-644]